ncbi:hypothetical protein ACGWY0_001716 [Enterococcus hirae]
MGAVKYEKRYDEDSEKRMVYELRANGEPNMHIGRILKISILKIKRFFNLLILTRITEITR